MNSFRTAESENVCLHYSFIILTFRWEYNHKKHRLNLRNRYNVDYMCLAGCRVNRVYMRTLNMYVFRKRERRVHLKQGLKFEVVTGIFNVNIGNNYWVGSNHQIRWRSRLKYGFVNCGGSLMGYRAKGKKKENHLFFIILLSSLAKRLSLPGILLNDLPICLQFCFRSSSICFRLPSLSSLSSVFSCLCFVPFFSLRFFFQICPFFLLAFLIFSFFVPFLPSFCIRFFHLHF